MNPAYFLCGEITLDLDLAKKGIEKQGQKIDLSMNASADGILTITRNNMTTATKEILINQGYDPRDFTLMSYSGSGGIFAAGIANDMSISPIAVPPTPGVFSARGMLTTDISLTFSRTYSRSLVELDIMDMRIIRGWHWQVVAGATHAWLYPFTCPIDLRLRTNIPNNKIVLIRHRAILDFDSFLF